jgi:hypothetical protein
MYVDFMLRRRANLDEPSPELNAKFVEQFVAVPDFWDARKTASDAPFEFTGESASLDLRTALVSGLAGQVLYEARFAGYLSRDIAQSDDFISLRLDTEEADYALFCSATLPRLIDIFRPYRAAAHTDDAVMLDDFDITRVQSQKTGRNINGRDSVYRIWPVCFFDDLLCRRAFGIGAAEVAARAAPECERAEAMCGGAFLLVTSEVVVGPGLDALSARVMARLVPV